ncbi:MAG: hypothetical protein K6E18_08715 [Lachnospiraceae bacterium]|nr:hypothetical protein [Lachnospiraceae bacterium]
MVKVEAANGKVEFQFCVEVDPVNGITRSVYKNERDEYYLIESEEYHIGSAYDYVDTCYFLDKSEKEIYEKIAIDRERRLQEERQERERIEREDRMRLRTAGSDRYFYKKKKSDSVWWLKESAGGPKISFDKEVVFDLMRDYPDKLSAEQKEIFDKENPFWAKKLQPPNC